MTELNFVNTWTTIGIPLLVFAVIFVANISIWSLILANAAPADRDDIREGLGAAGRRATYSST